MTEETLRKYRDIKRERAHLKIMLLSLDATYGTTEHKLAIDAMQQYHDKIRSLNDQLIAIENAIETLEPRERQAIRMHYIDGLPWEQIGYAMHYEHAQIYRIRKAAIEKLKNA